MDDASPPKRPRRARRPDRVRARTLTVKAMAATETDEDYPAGVERPRTRGECKGGARPCPFVSCSQHTYLDVNPDTGSIKLNYPDREVWELEHSCVLDIADQGGLTLEDVGDRMRLTRERVRQIEVRALLGLKRSKRLSDL